MIFLTQQGKWIEPPALFAYGGGVWCFPFYGDETFTDPHDDSVWIYEGTENEIIEIIGANVNGVNLTPTVSIADCESLANSFFWDDDNGVAYVHWPASVGDWSVGRSICALSSLYAGYASKYNPITKNIYDGLYYDPIITGLTGYTRKVDPQKLGLIAFSDSSITLTNQNGKFDALPDTEAIGSTVRSYYVADDETELRQIDRVSTGQFYGYSDDRSGIKLNIIESRLYNNVPVCPGKIILDDYANAGDAAGKLKPVAWGKIRRGKCVLVNEDAITTAGTESTILLLADPDVGELLAVDNIYDQDGNALAAFTESLTNCTATFNKAAGVSKSDLNKYTWEGRGYDITGTYNNGLDIIKAAFLSLAGVPYLESTYNRTQWNAETLVNTQSVGISLQSDKGFIEELIEPIVTSLQGSVIIQGDGRITYVRRDTSTLVNNVYEAYHETKEPALNEGAEQIISELLIEYSPDFTNKDRGLSFVYTDEAARVIADYGINRREPISPLKTVLTELTDVEGLAVDVMETAGYGETTPEFEKPQIEKSLSLFECIGVDVGRHDSPLYAYGEILQIQPDYLKDIEKIKIRVFDSAPNLPLYHQGRLYGTAIYSTAFSGVTRILGSED